LSFHAADVAQAFALAVARPALGVGHAFHVAAREPTTLREYATQAAAWFGGEANLALLPWNEWVKGVSARDAAITLDHVEHSPCASIERARSRLGFEPKFGAVAAAKEAVDWLVEQGMVSVG